MEKLQKKIERAIVFKAKTRLLDEMLLDEPFSRGPSYAKVYKKVLKHRQTCPSWNQEPKVYCLDCQGGGLINFTKEYLKECHKNIFNWYSHQIKLTQEND